MFEREDWKRLDTLLEAALERPKEERARFLDEACPDAEDRKLLARLLALADDTDPHLEPAGEHHDALFGDLASGPEGQADGLEAPSPLATGTELGRFVILGVLGAGGMGQVYRARDQSLGREVAIKAVARRIRDNPAHARRFEREARVLASLNHPNVGAIYGLESIEGEPYLVLELVEGETLGERLKMGALPLPEAMSVGVQIAEALEEAHRHGIVHRDLKPANVKLTEAGRVKVLDFGIAKSIPDAEAKRDASSSEPTTLPGTLLGTAPYMSPEQVRGLPVDTRSDLWAFGCVLYEMLSGQRAFSGRSGSDVLASVLRDEVDLSALPKDAPAGVRQLLRRCLRKDPRDRLQSAGDARIELTEAAMEDPPAPAPKAGVTGRLVVPALALGLAAALAILALRSLPTEHGPRPGLAGAHLSLELPAGLSLHEGYAAPFALSRDGRRLAVVAGNGRVTELFVRDLGGIHLRPLSETASAWQPVFSPDGGALAFFADRKLKTVRLGGGAPDTLAEVGGNPRGVAWTKDGTLVFAPSQTSALMRMEAGGGPVQPLTHLDLRTSEVSHRWPQALPDGRHVLFTVAFEDLSYDDARIDVVDVASGRRRPILDRAAHGRLTADHRLLFARGGRLLAVPFDHDLMAVKGVPGVVVEGVRYDPQNGGTHMAVADTGLLVYTPGSPTTPERSLSFIDASGHSTPLTETRRVFREPRLSPDEKRVAVVVGVGPAADLFVLDRGTRTLSQVTIGLGARRPVWSPDGLSLVVGAPASEGWQLLGVPLRGGATVPLLESQGRVYPSGFTPDGRRLVYQQRSRETGWDLFVAAVDAQGRLGAGTPLAAGPFQEANAAVSPDGRFVAYESDELDGVYSIYVRPLAGDGAKVQAAPTSGRWPRFGRTGRLFFWHTSPTGGLRRVDYRAPDGRFMPGAEVDVWAGEPSAAAAARRVRSGLALRGYDVDPATERFLMLEVPPVPDPPLREPVVVVGGLADPVKPALPPP